MGIWGRLWGYGAPQRGRFVADGAYAFQVIGEGTYQAILESIAGGCPENGCRKYCAALIAPEPFDKDDPNKLQVLVRGQKVGHVPAAHALLIHYALRNADCTEGAIEAVIIGTRMRRQDGRADKAHFEVRLNLAEPPRIERSSSDKAA